jgi:hypothetical protein
MSCKHMFTDWFCPYFDRENEMFRDTCFKCGKIKYIDGTSWTRR